MGIRILLVGNDARGQAIAEAIVRSEKYNTSVFAYMEKMNPGIALLAEECEIGGYDDVAKIVAFARRLGHIDFAVISPEKPLAHGVVDVLEANHIPCVGPKKEPAKIETSKAFARELLEKYGIPGNSRHQIFTWFDLARMGNFIYSLGQVVIKPDGLTGGKGVMVQGEHFQTEEEALRICHEILKTHPAVIIEEKLEGQEFSLQCLVDGVTVVATPPVQDHKRRLVGDEGLNTGGMGSYSCADHSLPFLKPGDLDDAVKITRQVAAAIAKETRELYKGILYGGFMATAKGVKLVEFNARFGDPEAMNILPLMETDFVDVCLAIINGRLHEVQVRFQEKATVCKYLVPRAYGRDLPLGHPDLASNSAKIHIGDIGEAELYYSSVEKRSDGIYTTSSRTVAVVGVADSLLEANMIAEKATKAVSGPVDHRPDIGTQALIQKRVEHMKALRG